MKKKGEVGIVQKEVSYMFDLGGGYEVLLPYQIFLFANTRENIFFTLNLN